MVSYARMAAFMAFAIPISMLPAWYVMFRLAAIFGLSLGIFFWAGVVILGLLFLAGMGMSAVSDNPSLRGVNITLAVWVGFFLILLFCLIFFDIIGLVTLVYPALKLDGRFIVPIAAILAIAGAANATSLRIKKVTIPAKGLKRALRIVLISDLHLGPVHGLAYFRNVIKKANAQRPDIVLITGDLIDGTLTDRIFSPINDLKAPVFFSPGNHEHYAGLDDVVRFLGRTKAQPLLNKLVDLGDYELGGIDFDWDSKAFGPMVDKVRPSGKKFSILMSHGPPAFDAARKAGFHLTLSGHTHGGQFWPFTMFGRLFVKYRVGLYEREGKHLFVTSGTGTWGPPIRLGVNSELAVIDVRKPGKAG